MFTASHFKLMRKKSPSEFEELLNMLQVTKPDFENCDEYEIYEKLDKDIEDRLKTQMKSKFMSEVYSKLLQIVGINFSRSETPNQQINKILANRERILSRLSETSQDMKLTFTHAKYFEFLNLKSTIENVTNRLDREALFGFKKSLERLTNYIPSIKDNTLLIKEKFQLSEEAEQQIKEIILHEIVSAKEIVISVIEDGNNIRDKSHLTRAQVNDTFNLLELISKIFENIQK